MSLALIRTQIDDNCTRNLRFREMLEATVGLATDFAAKLIRNQIL
ncbi:MAG: hypothetical protein PVF15_03305 [Candidatus Bathyarchaeota archaeon]